VFKWKIRKNNNNKFADTIKRDFFTVP